MKNTVANWQCKENHGGQNVITWTGTQPGCLSAQQKEIRTDVWDEGLVWPTFPKIIFPSVVRSLYPGINENHRRLGLEGTISERPVSLAQSFYKWEIKTNFPEQQSQLSEEPGLAENLLTSKPVFIPSNYTGLFV